MKFNIYAYGHPGSMQQLKDELGWWEHGGDETEGELVAVCMILAERVDCLEKELGVLRGLLDGKDDLLEKQSDGKGDRTRGDLDT